MDQVSKTLPPEEVPSDTQSIKIEDFVPMEQNSTSDDYSPENISYVENEETIEEIP